MIEELKRRKEARNAKKAKRINLSLENKKKEYKRDCLNHSTEGLSFSKSMSHRLKKP